MSEQMELFRTLEKDLNFELHRVIEILTWTQNPVLQNWSLRQPKKGRLAHCFLKCRQCLQAKLWLTPMY